MPALLARESLMPAKLGVVYNARNASVVAAGKIFQWRCGKERALGKEISSLIVLYRHHCSRLRYLPFLSPSEYSRLPSLLPPESLLLAFAVAARVTVACLRCQLLTFFTFSGQNVWT